MIKRYDCEEFSMGHCGLVEAKQGDKCKYEEVVQMLERLAGEPFASEGDCLREHILDELELMRLRSLK